MKKLLASLVASTLLLFASASPSQASQNSCIMPNTGTVSGLVLVNDITACANSLLTLYSGASVPSSPQTYQYWADTSVTPTAIRQYDGASWQVIGFINATTHVWTPPIGGGSATLASSATTDLGSQPSAYVAISGTVTITSLGSSAVPGTIHIVSFSSSLTLTYNAASLYLPGRQNITTQAGDTGIFLYLGSGNWQCLTYTPAPATKATPVAADLVQILDSAASFAPKQATASSLAAVAAVTGIDGQVGLFTTGNGLASTGNVIQLSAARRTLPTRQIFLTGSGTYTTPANVQWIRIRMVGGGAGGGGGNTSGSSTAGGLSSFSGGSLIAGGGGAAALGLGGPGGSATGGNVMNVGGGAGGGASGAVSSPGGMGGTSFFGGAGGGSAGNVAGIAATANSGSGGGGGGGNATANIAAGGGAGGYVEHVIQSPASSYTYAVGAGGAGATGTSAGNGGNGAAGQVIVEEFYN